MHTAKIGYIDLSIPGLNSELSNIYKLELKSVYQEFICGSWLTLPLWNETGKDNDLIIKSYEGSGNPTELVKKLPLLNSILNQHFDLGLVKYVRLALLAQDSVILPHRDYLETQQEFLRFHIPLITDQFCFYAEEQNVYTFSKGEIWFIDARKAHSVACFSDHGRLHIILDFPLLDDIEKFINKSVLFDLPQKPKAIKRKPLSKKQYQAILSFSELITINNFMDIASILTKFIYQTESLVTDIFAWLKEIAKQNGNQQLIARIDKLQQHCISSR